MTDIKFSKQAEDMLNQLTNKEEVRKMLVKQAEERSMWITGSDVIKFMVTGKVAENMQ